MLLIGLETQGTLFIVAIIVMIFIFLKYSLAGIPRLRVLFLGVFCMITWIICFTLALINRDPAHALLYDMMSFLGMAATLFMLFVAIFEILSSPGY